MAVVLVVHDSAHLLSASLESVSAAADRITARTVVVDSGSSDNPASVCRRYRVPIRRVANRGLGAAFNGALADEEVRHARYVLQLNPDVRLPAGGLDMLVASADRRAACGILAPRQVDQHGGLIHSLGVQPGARQYWRSIRRTDAEWVYEESAYSHPGEADWAMGACLLLRREMLREVGGFDERFFLCSEEVDLCRRARAAGWTVGYTPAVTVVHPLAEREEDEHRLRLEEWSRILYMRKWHPLAGAGPDAPAVAVRLARMLLLSGSRGDPAHPLRIRLGAALRFDPRRNGPAPPAEGRRRRDDAGSHHGRCRLPAPGAHPAPLAERRRVPGGIDHPLPGPTRRGRAEPRRPPRGGADAARGARTEPTQRSPRPGASARGGNTAGPRSRRCAVSGSSARRRRWRGSTLTSSSARPADELLHRLGDGSVLLTPHRYRRAFPGSAPGEELAARYGSFNGGTIVFRARRRWPQGGEAVACANDRLVLGGLRSRAVRQPAPPGGFPAAVRRGAHPRRSRRTCRTVERGRDRVRGALRAARPPPNAR